MSEVSIPHRLRTVVIVTRRDGVAHSAISARFVIVGTARDATTTGD